MSRLTDLYQSWQAPAKAEPLIGEVVEVWKSRSQLSDSVGITYTLAVLGRLLLQHKKAVDAEPILRECLAFRAKKQPDL
jgi:hypothetical protein